MGFYECNENIILDGELRNKALTLKEYIVLYVGLFSHKCENDILNIKEKEILDAVHLQKIDLSNAIFVIDVGDFAGE